MNNIKEKIALIGKETEKELHCLVIENILFDRFTDMKYYDINEMFEANLEKFLKFPESYSKTMQNSMKLFYILKRLRGVRHKRIATT